MAWLATCSNGCTEWTQVNCTCGQHMSTKHHLKSHPQLSARHQHERKSELAEMPPS